MRRDCPRECHSELLAKSNQIEGIQERLNNCHLLKLQTSLNNTKATAAVVESLVTAVAIVEEHLCGRSDCDK